MTGYLQSIAKRKNTITTLPDRKLLFTSSLLLASLVSHAQETAATEGMNNNLEAILLGVLVVTIVIVLFVVYIVSDKLLALSAAKVRGYDTEEIDDSSRGASLLPSKEELIGSNNGPSHVTGPIIRLKKGFDVNITGKPKRAVAGDLNATTYAVKPTDFIGLMPIPKMLVEVGDQVKAGDKLFFDKQRPDIFFSAPVSGEIVDVKRGAKRAIIEIIILADKQIEFKDFGKADSKNLTRQQVTERLVESGAWISIRQRPFDTVAEPGESPKGIFISGFDSSPLAANYNYTLAGLSREFQAGVDALAKLTDGKVHLNLHASHVPCDTFANAKGVEKHWFEGPHPAGAIGVQIHHLSPIAKGETAWYINPNDVVAIGRLFADGQYNTARKVAVAGPEVKAPQYYNTYLGANIENLVKGNLKKENVRVITGNVLTGKKIDTDGYLGYFDNLVSVVEEGDFYEMFGWLLPSYARPSLSPTFPWGLFSGYEFDVNTNTHGEERAFVVTGQYEAVTPMDIYPQHLLKAIMARDFERMEGLGIYELGEEDLALCEFVCTSKQPVQEILREGLDYMREQS